MTWATETLRGRAMKRAAKRTCKHHTFECSVCVPRKTREEERFLKAALRWGRSIREGNVETPQEVVRVSNAFHRAARAVERERQRGKEKSK